MPFRQLTISYDNFHDEQEGIVPYLASAVMMLIRDNDMDALQNLINNISTVSEQLLDLNDEILAKKEDYDQLKNRISALREDVAQKEAAQAALEEQMKQLVGAENTSESDENNADNQNDSQNADHKESIRQSYLSELDDAFEGISFGDNATEDLSALDVENTMSDSQEFTQMFKNSGVVFGEDIDKLAEAEQDELNDNEIYDFLDIQIEDVDQGYQPVEEASGGKDAPKQDAFDEVFSDDSNVTGGSDSPQYVDDFDYDDDSADELGNNYSDDAHDDDDYDIIFNGNNIDQDDDDFDLVGIDDDVDQSDDDFDLVDIDDDKVSSKNTANIASDVPTTGMVDLDEFV